MTHVKPKRIGCHWSRRHVGTRQCFDMQRTRHTSTTARLPKTMLALLTSSLLSVAACQSGQRAATPQQTRPNVILIITDDQGWGDLGCNGNDKIRTPNLDRLSAAGVQFNHFYVCPVCSPTRASLMTGRYNYRTGVVDTFMGRSMMHPDEVTLAEALSAHGYRTGIFGKWHLGDNYPMRPIDQGFDESLIHLGGGLAQPSGPPDNGYFDPLLYHNGREVKTEGYCTDIFTDAAIRFVEQNRDRPFFIYLPTNAPHSPLQIADAYADPYRAKGLDDVTARVYGMVTNIDDNVGRLLATLDTLDLAHNTLVIFLTDNGPSGKRYNGGMRGDKCDVYEGGIHVPCFMRWPARLRSGRTIEPIAAHIDVFPTVLAACGVEPPDVQLDGVNLLPLMDNPDMLWPDRLLFVQWHRGDEPVPFRNCAVRAGRYKLVNGAELYDLIADPAEKTDIAAAHSDIVARMRADYEAWLKDVSSTRGYAPSRIVIGTEHENPVRLSRQDWRAAEGWSDDDLGHWAVRVAAEGVYDITLQFPTTHGATAAFVRVAGQLLEQPVDGGAAACRFKTVRLTAGDQKLEAWVEARGKKAGPWFVEVQRIE
ncbi:MAG: arylsulfatase [Phycisphaerae bacterium]|nr:arylsulfatase [Phycisphaerae bacterium]